MSRSQFTLAVFVAILSATTLVPAHDARPSGRLINSRAIAFNQVNGKIYAVDEERGAVTVIDSRTGVTASVKVGAGPEAIAVNSVTGRVYVANASDGTVSELDEMTNAVVRSFKAGAHPYVLAVNESTGKVYVSNTFSDSVAEIDLSTNTTRFLAIGSADNIVVDSRRNHIFMIGYEDPKIRMLTGATDSVATFTAHEHLWGMALGQDSGKLYVTDVGTSELFAVDPATGKRTQIAVGSIPCAVSVNARTNMIYVLNYGDDSVTAVDGKTDKAVAMIHVGSRPQALTVDPRVNRIYVANTHADSVTIIDGETNAPLVNVAAGRNPYAIATGADPRTVYVANFGEPSFTAVSVATK
jgi:YVTN family beta-propeller protein